jgi:hypothetical protein
MTTIRNLELGDKIYSQIKSLPKICQKYISKPSISFQQPAANQSKGDIEQSISVSQKLSLDQSVHNENLYTSPDLKNGNKIVQNYEELKQFGLKIPIDKTINSPVYKLNLNSHNPSGWLDSLSGMNTWSNREISWLQSNSMFIFAVKSKLEQNKWV